MGALKKYLKLNCPGQLSRGSSIGLSQYPGHETMSFITGGNSHAKYLANKYQRLPSPPTDLYKSIDCRRRCDLTFLSQCVRNTTMGGEFEQGKWVWDWEMAVSTPVFRHALKILCPELCATFDLVMPAIRSSGLVPHQVRGGLNV